METRNVPYPILRVRRRPGTGLYSDEELAEIDFASSSESGFDSAGEPISVYRRSGQGVVQALQPTAVTTAAAAEGRPQAQQKKRRAAARTAVQVRVPPPKEGNMLRYIAAEPLDNYDFDSDAEIDIDEFRELYTIEYKSNFTEILTQPEAREKWDEFSQAPEEEQHRRLKKFDEDMSARHQSIKNAREESSAYKFSRIDPQIRTALHRHHGFVKHFEQEVITFIEELNDNEDEDVDELDLTMFLRFKDGFHRLMAHGICQYYGLSSESFDMPGGTDDRVTKVYKPRHRNGSSQSVSLPKTLLSNHMQIASNYQRSEEPTYTRLQVDAVLSRVLEEANRNAGGAKKPAVNNRRKKPSSSASSSKTKRKSRK